MRYQKKKVSRQLPENSCTTCIRCCPLALSPLHNVCASGLSCLCELCSRFLEISDSHFFFFFFSRLGGV
uniref:Uncharacterized protein n=1 Tax=Anguilla anguilla TaxID=7936 RepID=A0A0E9WEJ2_ANGAN